MYRSSFITYLVLGLAHTYASTVEKLLVFEAFPSSVHDNQAFPTIKHEAFQSSPKEVRGTPVFYVLGR